MFHEQKLIHDCIFSGARVTENLQLLPTVFHDSWTHKVQCGPLFSTIAMTYNRSNVDDLVAIVGLHAHVETDTVKQWRRQLGQKFTKINYLVSAVYTILSPLHT